MSESNIRRLGFALVPKQLVDKKLKVRFMYREEPDNEYDSGWRFFSGFETDEYVNNAENIGLYDVSTITEIDPDIVPLLCNPYGSVFEREDSSGPFVVSDVFKGGE